MTKNNQCQAKTKSGKTCRRKALPNAKFCFQHNIVVEHKTPVETDETIPPQKDPVVKKRHDNGQMPPESSRVHPSDALWDLVKASAIVVATYLTYRIIRAITKR